MSAAELDVTKRRCGRSPPAIGIGRLISMLIAVGLQAATVTPKSRIQSKYRLWENLRAMQSVAPRQSGPRKLSTCADIQL